MTTEGWKGSSRFNKSGKRTLPPQWTVLTGFILIGPPESQRGTSNEARELGFVLRISRPSDIGSYGVGCGEADWSGLGISGPVALKTGERIKEDWELGWHGIMKGPVALLRYRG